jgi:hypothetical protein
MTTTIPACKKCKHYYQFEDFLPGFCKFHTYEEPDYINGIISKFGMSVEYARGQETLCSVEGKNFEDIY